MREKLELLALIFQLAGIPAAIFVYWQSKRREQIDREKGTFDTLAERYCSYLRLCLDYVHLPVFDRDYAPDAVEKMDITDRKRTCIIFCELLGLLESAFLLYQEHHRSPMHRRQWRGWESYAEDYLQNPAFAQLAPEMWGQFDEEFQLWMKRLLLRVTAS